VISHPLKVSIPLEAVESEPAMSESDYESLLAENRARYLCPGCISERAGAKGTKTTAKNGDSARRIA